MSVLVFGAMSVNKFTIKTNAKYDILHKSLAKYDKYLQYWAEFFFFYYYNQRLLDFAVALLQFCDAACIITALIQQYFAGNLLELVKSKQKQASIRIKMYNIIK